MKNMASFKLFKNPLIYIILSVFILALCALLMYLPKRLSKKIRLNDINEVYLEYYGNGVKKEIYPVKMDDSHLDEFKSLVKKTTYNRVNFIKYKITSHIIIKVVYSNVTTFEFGNCNLYYRSGYNPIILNNTFDFKEFISWFDVE